jgi:hypothetical protein
MGGQRPGAQIATALAQMELKEVICDDQAEG